MYTCEYCKKEFNQNFILNRHQRESKKCISIKTNIKIEDCFSCNFCNKELSSNQRLKSHMNICKKKSIEKEDKKYDELEQKVTEMTKVIEKLKTTNITINNTTDNSTTNIMNNYTPLLKYMTSDIIKDTFEKNYTIKDLSGSQKGLANFTSKHFLSGKNKAVYLCTDRSRQHFVFPDEKEKTIEDQNAMILIALVSKGFGAVKKLYKKQLTELNNKLKKFQDADNLLMITEIFNEIKHLENNYQQILSTQDEGDNYRNQLSKILPSNIDNRLLIDSTLENFSDDEESEEKKSNIPILYDKTARNIGGITYGKLRLYKNHYQKTGKIIIPDHYLTNEEYKKEFLLFLNSDE